MRGTGRSLSVIAWRGGQPFLIRGLPVLAALVWVGFLAVVSFQTRIIYPTLPGPLDGLIAADAMAHFGAYGGLAFLLGIAFRPRQSRRWALLVAVCVALGVTDELHQLLVPGRAFAVSDILADAAGSLAGLAVAGLSRWAVARWPLRFFPSVAKPR